MFFLDRADFSLRLFCIYGYAYEIHELRENLYGIEYGWALENKEKMQQNSHGKTFNSEDLQALFNEYAWYKADKDYSDTKLSDTDKANIKMISEFEKK